MTAALPSGDATHPRHRRAAGPGHGRRRPAETLADLLEHPLHGLAQPGVTEAGASSTDHSCGSPPSRARTAAPSRRKSVGASSPGVPPPQNTVVTGRVHSTSAAGTTIAASGASVSRMKPSAGCNANRSSSRCRSATFDRSRSPRRRATCASCSAGITSLPKACSTAASARRAASAGPTSARTSRWSASRRRAPTRRTSPRVP